MGNASVVTVPVTLTGLERIATVQLAQTPACPAMGWCAVGKAVDIAPVGNVSVLSLVHMEIPVRRAQLVLMPAPSKSECQILIWFYEKETSSYGLSLRTFQLFIILGNGTCIPQERNWFLFRPKSWLIPDLISRLVLWIKFQKHFGTLDF